VRANQTKAIGIALLVVTAASADAQDIGAGAATFKQRCSLCHSAVLPPKPGIGPNLATVAGRKAASTDYTYSAALKASGLTWNAATLDRFLSGPGKLVPGTRMMISVSDDKQRADLVAYLETLKK
jgi:cytochrome c